MIDYIMRKSASDIQRVMRWNILTYIVEMWNVSFKLSINASMWNWPGDCHCNVNHTLSDTLHQMLLHQECHYYKAWLDNFSRLNQPQSTVFCILVNWDKFMMNGDVKHISSQELLFLAHYSRHLLTVVIHFDGIGHFIALNYLYTSILWNKEHAHKSELLI